MIKKEFPDEIANLIQDKVAGSVDEKYPFAVHNIMKIGVPSIILIDGGGYKKTALY